MADRAGEHRPRDGAPRGLRSLLRCDDVFQEQLVRADDGTWGIRVSSIVGSDDVAALHTVLARLARRGINAAPRLLQHDDGEFVREAPIVLSSCGGRRIAQEDTPATAERLGRAQARADLEELLDALHAEGWVLGAVPTTPLAVRADGRATVADLRGVHRVMTLSAQLADRRWLDDVLQDADRTLVRDRWDSGPSIASLFHTHTVPPADPLETLYAEPPYGDHHEVAAQGDDAWDGALREQSVGDESEEEHGELADAELLTPWEQSAEEAPPVEPIPAWVESHRGAGAEGQGRQWRGRPPYRSWAVGAGAAARGRGEDRIRPVREGRLSQWRNRVATALRRAPRREIGLVLASGLLIGVIGWQVAGTELIGPGRPAAAGDATPHARRDQGAPQGPGEADAVAEADPAAADPGPEAGQPDAPGAPTGRAANGSDTSSTAEEAVPGEAAMIAAVEAPVHDPHGLMQALAGQRHAYVTGTSDQPVARPGSPAAAQDDAAREAYATATVAGGESRVHDATLDNYDRYRGTAHVRATVSTPQHTVTDAAGTESVVAADEPVLLIFHLAWQEDRWMIESVETPTST